MLGDFPLGIDSRSNDFRKHMNGGVSSKDKFQAL